MDTVEKNALTAHLLQKNVATSLIVPGLLVVELESATDAQDGVLFPTLGTVAPTEPADKVCANEVSPAKRTDGS
ncbi:MAG: hypothetical protein CMK74_02220 [Pseudomonadales bacterium]|nr:hypothetical protein [Pseudomonadales bacterium]